MISNIMIESLEDLLDRLSHTITQCGVITPSVMCLQLVISVVFALLHYVLLIEITSLYRLSFLHFQSIKAT